MKLLTTGFVDYPELRVHSKEREYMLLQLTSPRSQQVIPEQSRLINSTTSGRKKCIFDYRVNSPFKPQNLSDIITQMSLLQPSVITSVNALVGGNRIMDHTDSTFLSF